MLVKAPPGGWQLQGRALETETIAEAATMTKNAQSTVKIPYKKKNAEEQQPPKKKRQRLQDHQCQHCGRKFTMEGLQYHTKERVCLRGSDTSKRVSACELICL